MLFSNGFVNTSALIGTIIGLSIAEMHNIEFVTAFVAGNFLYIGLVEMMPEIVKETDLVQSLLHTFAIIIGFVIMFAITFLEEH